MDLLDLSLERIGGIAMPSVVGDLTKSMPPKEITMPHKNSTLKRNLSIHARVNNLYTMITMSM